MTLVDTNAPSSVRRPLPRFIFVVPVYNQEKHLRANAERLAGFLRGYPQSEIIFVENGSTDGSAGILEGLQREGLPVNARFLALPHRGLGRAYRAALELPTSSL